MKFTHKLLIGASLFILSMMIAACSGLPPKGGVGAGPGAGATTFTIGGTVKGLTGTGLVLQDNGGDNLAITAPGGAFTFKTPVATGAKYAVTVFTQPKGQVCSVASSSGTASANVSNVQVTCGTPSISIGGSVTGLAGSGLVLQNNGGDNLTITANGAFTFAALLLPGAPYSVTILTQPTNPAQICGVTSGSGTANANVATVRITCPAVTESIGGIVVGLLGTGGGMELQDNGGDNLTIATGNGPFTFKTQLAFGGAYNTTVFIQPGSQPQPCLVFNGSGTAKANVTNIIVDCGHNDWTWMTGSNGSNSVGADTEPPQTLGPPVSANANAPGARNFPATWTDLGGNLWMFGGIGFTPNPAIPLASQPLFLNEMWEYRNTQSYCLVFVVCPTVFGWGWTWVNAPFYVPPASPAARWGAVTWTDAAGDLWMFGGQDGGTHFLNDLWRFHIASKVWTHVGGSLLLDQGGTYGTKGTPSGANIPGGRWAASARIDGSGKVWLFGGQGFDSTTTNGLLNDLWKYDPLTNQWTWMSGSNVMNQNGSYGTLGTASAANTPGGRQAPAAWIDLLGNFWTFGGFGLDATGTPNGSLNDLWKFDPVAGQWTWVSGLNAANQQGVYGTQGTAAPSNAPGSRWRAAAWTDAGGNLWLFGGFGHDATMSTGMLNDMWQYKGGQWTWMQGSNSNSQPGSYGAQMIPFVGNSPGGRWGAGYWVDTSNQLWLFGGQGFDSSASSGNGYLNDLWRYVPYP